MSAPPHDGWPQEGSVWEHWSDLLVATQLAALRSGFNAVCKSWDNTRPNKLVIRCHVDTSSVRDSACASMLVRARPYNPGDLAGAYRVDILRNDNLEAGRHVRHRHGYGLSRGFPKKPSKGPKLQVGTIITDWRALHRLEGSLRAEARTEGRFLAAYGQRQQLNSIDVAFSQQFACIIGERCQFYVRFAPHEQNDGVGWICDTLCSSHSCSSVAPVISECLSEKLSFWPRVRFGGDYSKPSDRRVYGREQPPMTITDHHLSYYPVLALGESTPRHILPPPDPSLTDKLETKRSSLSKALDSLASTRQEIVNLRTKISLASILDETDEVKNLSAGMGDLETKREKKLRKVEKKKRKIEKIEEKIKAKQMEQKKVEGTKSKPAKMKKGGKGKKEKGKI